MSARGGHRPPQQVVRFLFDFVPRWIRIEAGYLFSDGCCVGAEILLINVAVVADNECLDAGSTVFCWPRYHGESPDHYAVDNIVESSTGSIGILSLQDSEIVSMVRFGSGSFVSCCGLGRVLSR